MNGRLSHTVSIAALILLMASCSGNSGTQVTDPGLRPPENAAFPGSSTHLWGL
jgi:hypothetical protein